ncbi:low molecular weight protein arginine phosphatase [Gracilibacillus salitolerans]|uniref:Low molecular weight protein arginine phosphatase n=1 Tax=Gracilibacillus salitolerans TaxID=2663022 RepID=A0A5Q2TRL3_9BACI|nr:low molecular weight protein arginine phosphatase [Gracilibacillus salitolerans]QGH36350.1 low molecular weight protein arginine phosphatase [Gracilibacillus salitolerans]
MNILFVCTGNTCRSPMAQAIFQHKTKHHVQSAGIFAGEGMPASMGTTEVLKQQGISSDHKSQPVTDDLMKWADLIITMTKNHRDLLKQSYPADADKIYTLKEYADPQYEHAWNKLKESYAHLEEAKLAGSEVDANLTDQINQLEKTVQNVDIIDPFGGNYMTYQKTYQELDIYLALLVKKIENKDR